MNDDTKMACSPEQHVRAFNAEQKKTKQNPKVKAGKCPECSDTGRVFRMVFGHLCSGPLPKVLRNWEEQTEDR